MEAHWELDAKNMRLGPLELAGAKVRRVGILGSGEPVRSHRRWPGAGAGRLWGPWWSPVLVLLSFSCEEDVSLQAGLSGKMGVV